MINPDPGSNTRLQKWVDPAMFVSEPLTAGPKVYLLAAPTDPLGSIAACCKMYKGEVVRDLAEVTDDERREYLAQVQKTRLQMPFESVQFHFLIEGVTRSFTHQLVRQRTAAYAQESLRFAVVEDDFANRVALPPSLAQLPEDHQLRRAWDRFVEGLGAAYSGLVNNGIPAEDARGLLPQNITTRVHYITNLRGLLDHAGNRLCTQAQFEWRVVFAQIARALLDFGYATSAPDTEWQYEELAGLLKPVCYQTGKCEFTADFDRKCSIRNRVQANHDIGRPSAQWSSEYDVVSPEEIVSGVGPASVLRDEKARPVFVGAIQPAEWLANPDAAR